MSRRRYSVLIGVDLGSLELLVYDHWFRGSTCLVILDCMIVIGDSIM